MEENARCEPEVERGGTDLVTHMGVGTLILLEEYLNATYRPDCDFVEVWAGGR